MNVESFHDRLRELYLPPQGRFTEVDVPEIRYAMIDGEGNPQSDDAARALKWLYAIVHVVKPLVKERMGKHFVEPPPECLIWADDAKDIAEGNRDTWKWRLMVVFVDWISQEQFDEAIANVEQKRGPAPPTLRLEQMHEGSCVQIMHVGDYGELSAICEKLYGEYMPANNLEPNGHYHELYLNDPARTAPEKRKVVIRQPVRPASSAD